MYNKQWKPFKKYYAELFNVEESLVDKIAVLDILRRCACGISSYKIAGYLGFEQEYVETTLLDYFGFIGWNTDLDFSPIALYNKSKGNLLAYEQEIISISGYPNEKVIKKTFTVCEKYSKIKEEVDDYYSRTA